MKKILLIDDEIDIIKSLTTILQLEDEEYEISSAEDGESGLEMARRIRPDVILLDIMLPNLSGIEVCRFLKSYRDYRPIHIIMMTCLGKTEDITKGLSAGADDYVAKPFILPELLSRVKSHLRSKELYDILKHEEQEKSVILDISRSLSSAINPREVLHIIVSNIAEAIEVKRCSIVYAGISKQKGFVMASNDSKEVRNLKIDLNKYPEIQKIIKTGKPVIINDAYTDPILFSVRDILSLIGIKSILGFPIIFKDAIIGTIILRTSRREKPFNNREIKFCQLISHFAAIPLKNAHLFELLHKEREREQESRIAVQAELKDSKNYFQTILQSMGEGIVVLDKDFRIQMVNRFLLKIMKMEEKEAIGEHCYRLIYRRKNLCPNCTVAETFKTGKPASACQTSIAEDGSTTYAELTSFPIFDNKGRVVQVIEKVADVSEQRKIEATLKEREQQMNLFALATSDMLWNWDIINNTIERSIGFEKVFGYTKKEIIPDIDWWIERLHPQDRQKVLSIYQDAVDKGGPFCSYEYRFRCRDGNYAIIEDKAYIVRDKKGIHVRSIGAMTDITMRKQAEEEKERMQVQLLHSQKMETVGQLAGGIAHEFNNILMAVMGYGETIAKEMNKSDPLRIKVNQILSLTKKAASFTKSLLTFSRKNVINPKIVKIDEIVENLKKLLLNLLGEDIELITKFSTKNLIIKADVGQIEQVLMNLATNARDAMRGGGRIFIKTGQKEISKTFIKQPGYGKRGKYAFLTFTDTGSGMDKKTMEKVFEPFFTTKDTGKGTGLGLSTVYGIIKQHKGFIDVQSRLGEGTTFEIYFPLVQHDDIEKIKSKVIPIEGGGIETILIAEDNEDVRKMIRDELVKFGYSVIEAVDGDNAVKIFKKKKKEIQLLLFDVIMPKKNGRKAFEEIKKEKPGIKHIFMSGYSKDILDSRGIASEKINYIFKPISIFELLRTVREVLDK